METEKSDGEKSPKFILGDFRRFIGQAGVWRPSQRSITRADQRKASSIKYWNFGSSMIPSE